MNRRVMFLAGLRDGFPICLGYIAVSFTFGIMGKNAGISVAEAVLMSALNLTSAGQFAGLSLIAAGSSYLELAITQLVINLRYCLMSCALTQKLDPAMPFFHRFFIAYGVTDEIFGISVAVRDRLHPFYSYGAILIAACGWSLGTFLGIVSGNILPARIVSALSVALYGMFIAIIIPPARENRVLAVLVCVSMLASLVMSVAPLLREISEGFRIILLTLVIAGAAAFLFPVKENDAPASEKEAPRYEA